MSKLKKLLESYTEFISIPWSHDIDPEQRIVFCVYNEADENRIRARSENSRLRPNKPSIAGICMMSLIFTPNGSSKKNMQRKSSRILL